MCLVIDLLSVDGNQIISKRVETIVGTIMFSILKTKLETELNLEEDINAHNRNYLK